MIQLVQRVGVRKLPAGVVETKSVLFKSTFVQSRQENMRGQRGTLRALSLICHSH